MVQKIKINDKEYDVENLSDKGKATLASMQVATLRMQELENMKALLQRSKNSYLESLKQEILSSKSGVLFESD